MARFAGTSGKNGYGFGIDVSYGTTGPATVTFSSYVVNNGVRFNSNYWMFSCTLSKSGWSQTITSGTGNRGGINITTAWSGAGYYNFEVSPLTFYTNNSNTDTATSWSFSNVPAGTYTISYKMYRSTGSYGSNDPGECNASGTITINPPSYWNDINAYQPGQGSGGAQNGLKFDIATSDGGRWSQYTNEPDNFTKYAGTTATISNINPNVTGAHYTRNNVTGNDASSFSWTFSQANWVCELFSDWNTWYIDYYGNGATGGSTGRSTHTYNTAKNLTSNGYYRTNYDFRGWSTSSTATTPTYSNGQSVSNLTTANNGVVNLYAVWRATKPSNVQTYTTARSYDYMDVEVSYTGVEISNITLYYKKSTDSSYTSVNMGTSTSTRISNLDMDTNYDLYCTVTNPGGSTSSSVLTTSTLLNALGITQPIVTNLLPFSCTVSAEGSLPVVRTLQYRFSNDGGTTWTAYQASNSYNWTGLNEETTYNFGVMVKAIHQGVDSTDMTVDDYVTATTPADQAKIRIKDNGEWLKGKMWYKINGEWVKAKKVYIKKNGEWVIGYNYENN